MKGDFEEGDLILENATDMFSLLWFSWPTVVNTDIPKDQSIGIHTVDAFAKAIQGKHDTDQPSDATSPTSFLLSNFLSDHLTGNSISRNLLLLKMCAFEP